MKPNSINGRTSRSINPKLSKELFIRDGGLCTYCNGLAIEIDHVVPVSWGGPTIPSNLVCCCHRCNSKKKNRSDTIGQEMVTAGLFHLMRQGEDISWVDTLDPNYMVNKTDLVFDKRQDKSVKISLGAISDLQAAIDRGDWNTVTRLSESLDMTVEEE